jgi:hypothetical protein
MTRGLNPTLSILLMFLILVCACSSPGNEDQTDVATRTEGEPEKEIVHETDKGEWVNYWPAHVSFRGELLVKKYFGPPDFGENPKTDSKENSWILSLSEPINVQAKEGADPLAGPSSKGVKELQLVLSVPRRDLMGKMVFVAGTLFHAHTGHHHTDVLMQVESIHLVSSDH